MADVSTEVVTSDLPESTQVDNRPFELIEHPIHFSRGTLSYGLWRNAAGGISIRPGHLYRPYPKALTYWRKRAAILPEEIAALIHVGLRTWKELAKYEPTKTPKMPPALVRALNHLQSELDAELAKQEETPHPDPKVDP